RSARVLLPAPERPVNQTTKPFELNGTSSRRGRACGSASICWAPANGRPRAGAAREPPGPRRRAGPAGGRPRSRLKAPAPPDAAVESAEEAVDRDPDDEHHQHQRQQLLGVGKVAGELQPLPELLVVVDDDG